MLPGFLLLKIISKFVLVYSQINCANFRHPQRNFFVQGDKKSSQFLKIQSISVPGVLSQKYDIYITIPRFMDDHRKLGRTI